MQIQAYNPEIKTCLTNWPGEARILNSVIMAIMALWSLSHTQVWILIERIQIICFVQGPLKLLYNYLPQERDVRYWMKIVEYGGIQQWLLEEGWIKSSSNSKRTMPLSKNFPVVSIQWFWSCPQAFSDQVYTILYAKHFRYLKTSITSQFSSAETYWFLKLFLAGHSFQFLSSSW